MSALNLSWLPEDADTREQEAEECWPVMKGGVPLVQWPPVEQDDSDWPPREHAELSDWNADSAIPSDHTAQTERISVQPPADNGAAHQSGPMQALQKVVDESSDHDVRWMRARGCDLMPKRWNGVDPNAPS